MRRVSYFVSFVYFVVLVCSSSAAEVKDAQVLFSPRGGCTAAIIAEIDAAKDSIQVQAFSFTSRPIAEALIAAHGRGVAVEVLVDKGQPTARGTQGDALASNGIPIRVDPKHAIAHNKIIIIDSQVVVTGSFNFTKSAEERNAENLLILHSEDLAAEYTANWRTHAEHCQPWDAKAETAKPRRPRRR